MRTFTSHTLSSSLRFRPHGQTGHERFLWTEAHSRWAIARLQTAYQDVAYGLLPNPMNAYLLVHPPPACSRIRRQTCAWAKGPTDSGIDLSTFRGPTQLRYVGHFGAIDSAAAAGVDRMLPATCPAVDVFFPRLPKKPTSDVLCRALYRTTQGSFHLRVLRSAPPSCLA